jgi:tetratricopeptide (TPR) repeat protein
MRLQSPFRPGGTLLALALACASTGVASAIQPEERLAIQSELSEPITIRLNNGQRITGNPIRVSENQLQLASAEGAGEIVFTFETAEIEAISLPGESYKNLAVEWMQAGDTEDATKLMAMLYEQRKALLPLLPASESHFFIYYVELVLSSPMPARAIAIIETLRPQFENPKAVRSLEDVTLESYQTLGLLEEALPLAEAWVAARQPYGESALGYYVLGAARLREEAYEDALDLALRPIVFTSPIPTTHMAECYAVAVGAALRLRERAYAATLYQEMQERGFQWPSQDSSLDIFLEEITEYISDHEHDQT